MPGLRALNLAATLASYAGRKLSEEQMTAWASTFELGATKWRLEFSLLDATLADAATEEALFRVTPADILARARTNPPRDWLVRRGIALEGPADPYFERPIRYPEGDDPQVVRTSRNERLEIDASALRWRDGPVAAEMLAKQRERLSYRDSTGAATRSLPKFRGKREMHFWMPDGALIRQEVEVLPTSGGEARRR